MTSRRTSRLSLLFAVVLTASPVISLSAIHLQSTDRATAAARSPTEDQKRQGALLLQKAVDGLGGARVVDRIRSLRAEGVSRRKLPSGERLEFATVSSLLFPARYLHEVTLPIGKVATVITGKDAYLIASGATTPLPEHERINIEDRILRLPVVLIRKRHHEFFEAIAEDAGEINGRRVAWLRLQIGSKVTRVAIDPETGRITRVQYRERAADGETGAEIVSTYSDYRTVKGLAYPFAVEVSVAGRPEFWGETRTLLVDEAVDAKLFKH